MFDVQWVREQERDYPGIIQRVTPEFLEAAGIMVQGAAKRNLTVMRAVDTGNLRSSINRQVYRDRAEIGTNVDYAEYVEYGTRYHPEQRPFMRYAIDQNRRNLLRRLAELIRARIEFGRN